MYKYINLGDTKEYATVFLEYLSGNWYKKQPEKAKKD